MGASDGSGVGVGVAVCAGVEAGCGVSILPADEAVVSGTLAGIAGAAHPAKINNPSSKKNNLFIIKISLAFFVLASSQRSKKLQVEDTYTIFS